MGIRNKADSWPLRFACGYWDRVYGSLNIGHAWRERCGVDAWDIRYLAHRYLAFHESVLVLSSEPTHPILKTLKIAGLGYCDYLNPGGTK